MPGAAHDGDVREAVLCRLADAAPHRCLTLEGEAVVFGHGTTDGRHCLGDRREQVAGIASRLDQAVPQPLAVLLPRGVGELGQRVMADELGFEVSPLPCFGVLGLAGGDRFGQAALELRPPDRHLGTGGEVDEPGGDVVLECPAQGNPLGAELRERVERGNARLIGRVDQERHRRAHRRVLDQADQVARVGRPLDKEGVRLQPLELGQHAPRGAGAVMADAQDGGQGRAAAVSRPPPDRPGRGRANRRVPSSPSRGTRARRRRPGPDRG